MTKRKKIMIGVVVAIAICGILMGFLFPAGNDSLVAQSASLAMHGKNFNHLLSLFEQRRMMGASGADPVSFSNSTSFARTVLKTLPGTHDERTDCWNVAVRFPKDMNDDFPVLISANFNPALLCEDQDEESRLPLGIESGAALSLLGDQRVVVIRKNGFASIISAKQCTRARMLGNAKGTICEIVYLTPLGKVALKMR